MGFLVVVCDPLCTLQQGHFRIAPALPLLSRSVLSGRPTHTTTPRHAVLATTSLHPPIDTHYLT